MQSDEIRAETKKIELIRNGIRWAPVALLILPAMLSGATGGLVINGILAFIAYKVVNSFVAIPITNAMFGRLSKRIRADLEASEPTASSWSWYYNRPGAMVVTVDDRIALIHECTNYEKVIITCDQIVKKGVEVQSSTVAHTKTSGSMFLGGMGSSGGILGFNTGTRSKTTYQQVHDYTYELMWQTQRNAAPHVAVIHAGSRVTADSIHAIIDRMSCQPPLQNVYNAPPKVQDVSSPAAIA
jgi:hypothetical protein